MNGEQRHARRTEQRSGTSVGILALLYLRTFTLAIISLGIAGCLTPVEKSAHKHAGHNLGMEYPPLISRATSVRVWFATDRSYSGSYKYSDKAPDKIQMFGSGRGQMEYGYCDVSIPFNHRTGNLERPRWYLLQFSEDPSRDIVVTKIAPEAFGRFNPQLLDALRSTKEGKILLFIHGYNVTFRDAALRAGQLAYDLDLRGRDSRGVTVFYSWPSLGKTVPYDADENNAEWTESDLLNFLESLLSQPYARNVYLIAHSMGSRPALRALAALATARPDLVRRVKGLILAAPDIDADTYRNQIAPLLASKHLTGVLYVSSRDLALKASRKLHGEYPRLGDPSAGPVILHGMETIDASAVDDGDFLGHNYFAARPVMLEDILNYIDGASVMPRFDLFPMQIAAGRYWRFGPLAH